MLMLFGEIVETLVGAPGLREELRIESGGFR
jgi:hypothetical protein